MAGGGLGDPRLHLRRTDSTNARARELAQRGAPHGTLVTASEQLAGRGRQGRTWSAAAGRSLLCSLIVRDPPRLAPLAAGVAVALAVTELSGRPAQIKWPNDILLKQRKVAGILVEGRPQEHWAVIGIGLNVAVRPEDLPAELRERAGTLGLRPEAIEPALARLLELLEVWLSAPDRDVLKALRARDALLGRPVHWAGGEGVGAGIDDNGLLVVALPQEQLPQEQRPQEQRPQEQIALNAGEVHLSAQGSE